MKQQMRRFAGLPSWMLREIEGSMKGGDRRREQDKIGAKRRNADRRAAATQFRYDNRLGEFAPGRRRARA